ncbi:MAG: protease inhibitor I9 family protein [Betaproteobacteria bacterium]|nr:protease inhibitor I9 family protein [Betaproteobacteria bacterium]
MFNWPPARRQLNGTIASLLPPDRPPAPALMRARRQRARSYSRFLEYGTAQCDVTGEQGAHRRPRYSVAFNGFAARLTDAEVQTLRGDPRVVQVHVDVARQLTTISHPPSWG